MLTNPIRESTHYSSYSRPVAGVLSLKELQGQLVTGLFADQTFCTGGETEGPYLLLACEMQPRLMSPSESHSNCVTPFTSVAECTSNCCSCESPEAMQESSGQVKRYVWDRLGGCVPQQEQKSQMNSKFVSGHNSTDVEEESNMNGQKVLCLSYYELELCSQTAPHHLATKSELVTGLSYQKSLAS